jgi:hypothetical protein
MERPTSAVYNSNHRYQRSNDVLNTQFNVNGLYYQAFLKQSNSQDMKKRSRPTSAKNLNAPPSLIFNPLEFRPIPEQKEEVHSIKSGKPNQAHMINS